MSKAPSAFRPLLAACLVVGGLACALPAFACTGGDCSEAAEPPASTPLLDAPAGATTPPAPDSGDDCPRDCHRCSRGCCAGPAVSMLSAGMHAPIDTAPSARQPLPAGLPALPGPGARALDHPPRR